MYHTRIKIAEAEMQSLMKNEMSYEIFFNGGNKLLKSNEKVMEAEATSMDSPGTIEFISDGDKLEIMLSIFFQINFVLFLNH